MRRIAVFLVMSCVAVLGLSAQPAGKITEIPLKRVVLYTSGLAYYEHSGPVDGNAVVRLSFKIDQVNDVLKSLVLRDFGGGSIQAVSYAAQDPIERSLASFALDLSGSAGLASLLDQVKGHSLVLSTPTPVNGRLLGLETRNRVVQGTGSSIQVQEVYVNLWADEGIKTIPLSSITGVQIQDQRLQEELGAALDLLKGSTDTRRRTVDILCSGKGRREVSFGYLAEAPVWKTSYRLDLTKAAPYLQAWAMVENSSDMDWKDVSLALAGGQPISFIQDLYTPLWVQRPVVQPFRPENIAPRTYDTGMEAPEAEMDEYLREEETMPRAKRAEAAPSPAPAVAASKAMAPSGPASADMSSGFAASASMNTEGELFFYQIKDPVSLARRQSAMIPLLAGDMGGRKVSIYNKATHARRPLYGAWISSPAGTRFPAGPLTVFEAGMYSGDALVDGLSDTEKKLLSYGLDLDVLVQEDGTSSRQTTGFSLVKGVLYQRYSTSWTTTYTMKNSSAQARTMVVEHPFQSSRTLVNPSTWEEKTPSHYRFVVELKAGENKSFKVEESQITGDSFSLINQRSGSILGFVSTGVMPEKVRQALAKAAQLKMDVETQVQLIAELNQKRSSLGSDQGRIRENIASVGRDSAQGQKYIQKLAEQEAAIEAVDKDLAQARLKQAQAQQAFEAYLGSLNLE